MNISGTGIVHQSYFSISQWSNVCPHCLRWFTLQLVTIKGDRVAEGLEVYR